MSSPPKPRKQPERPAQPPMFVDPKTGKPVVISDLRAEFERISAQTPQGSAAVEAFIESKIEMVRSDFRLSAAEKESAIAELRRRFSIE
jgi:hypothetical protein